MRVEGLAALAAIVGLAQPAFALDQVKFGTNWLADPEAGGFYQAAADGTYARYGLDVTIIPGGPQANGALDAPVRQDRILHGRGQIGNLLSAEAKLPLIAVAADFQKSPQILMSHPGRRAWTNGTTCRRRIPSISAPAPINTFYAWLRLAYGFKDENIRPYNFNSAPFIKNETFDPAGLCHGRALRDRAAGPFQAQRVPALRPRL